MTTKFNIEEKAKGLYNRIRFIPDRVTLYAIEQDFKDAYDAGKLEEREECAKIAKENWYGYKDIGGEIALAIRHRSSAER